LLQEPRNQPMKAIKENNTQTTSTPAAENTSLHSSVVQQKSSTPAAESPAETDDPTSILQKQMPVPSSGIGNIPPYNPSSLNIQSNSSPSFTNNRPQAVFQRKMQEAVNNSPQVKQSAYFHAMANTSSDNSQITTPLQKKSSSYAPTPTVQKKADSSNNTGLPNDLKSGIESLSGHYMDDVKVHYNSSKPAQLQAHAYAQGTDIHLGAGQEKHLPHEAWHVVQQKQGRVQPTTQMKGIGVNDDTGLEQEADIMGAKAMSIGGEDVGNLQRKKVKETSVQMKSDIAQLRPKSIIERTHNLHKAIKDGDLERVKRKLEKGANPFRKIGLTTAMEYAEKIDASDEIKAALMNSGKENIGRAILEKEVGTAKDELKSLIAKENKWDLMMNFEKLADNLAMIGGDITVNDGEPVFNYIERTKHFIDTTFGGNLERKYYLKSMLTSDNGTPVGIASKLGEMLLLSGLIYGSAPQANNAEIIHVAEKSSSAELAEISNPANTEFYQKILSRMSRKAKLNHSKNYLEQIVGNGTLNPNTEIADTGRIDPEALDINKIEEEAVSLLKLLKFGHYETTLIKGENKERIIAWAERYNRFNLVNIGNSSEGPLAKYLANYSAKHKTYITALIKTQGDIAVADGKEDTVDKELKLQEAYIAKKNESRHTGYARREKEGDDDKTKIRARKAASSTFIANIEQLSPEAKNKLIAPNEEDISTVTLRNNAIGDYIETFKGGKLKIKPTDRKRLKAAFKVGATPGITDKKSNYFRFKHYAKSGTSKNFFHQSKKLFKTLLEFDEDDYKVILQDPAAMGNVQDLFEKVNSDSRPRARRYMKRVMNLLGMSTRDADGQEEFEDIDSAALEANDFAEGGALATATNKILQDPYHWLFLIKTELNKTKKAYSKNKVYSLVTQAVYAMQDKVAAEAAENTVSHYTNIIAEGLDTWQSKHDKKSALKNKSMKEEVKSALRTGRIISAEKRMEAATYSKLSPKRLKGNGIRVSSVMDAIEGAKGRELLYEYTDFLEYKKYAPDNADEKVRYWAAYLPNLKPQFLELIQRQMPTGTFTEAYKNILYRIADAMTEDADFKKDMTTAGADMTNVRGDLLRAIGLFNEERVRNTGWQMKWFNTKAIGTRAADRDLTVHARSTNKEIRNKELGVGGARTDAQKGRIAEKDGKLKGAIETKERRTEDFSTTKDTAIQAIMTAVAIIVGILTTIGSLGLAAPVAAAVSSAFVGQLILSLGFTAVASTAKFVLEKMLTGASYNTTEGVANIFKDVLLAFTTVGAGELSGKFADAVVKEGSKLALLKVANPAAYAFVENLLFVSNVEVGLRFVVEYLDSKLTASEKEDRMSLDPETVSRLFFDYVVDGVLKGSFGDLTEHADAAAIGDAQKTIVGGEAWMPSLQKMSAAQVITIIAGENFLTAQNYSVAEQTALVPFLAETFVFDKIQEKVWGGSEEAESSEAEETEETTAAPGLEADLLSMINKDNRADILEKLQERKGRAAADLPDLLVGKFIIDCLEKELFSMDNLRQAGFTPRQLKLAIDSLEEGDASYLLYVKKLKKTGFPRTQLKDAGFTATEMKLGKFKMRELKAAGFTVTEMKDAGFKNNHLRKVGYTALEMKDAGFTAKQLRRAKFDILKIKEAGYTATQIKEAGFTATEMKEAEFTAKQLRRAGFTNSQLRTAGFKMKKRRKARVVEQPVERESPEETTVNRDEDHTLITE
jgi:ribosomal protein L13E